MYFKCSASTSFTVSYEITEEPLKPSSLWTSGLLAADGLHLDPGECLAPGPPLTRRGSGPRPLCHILKTLTTATTTTSLLVLFCFCFLNRTISCFCVNTVSCPVAHSSVTANTFLYLYIHVCKKQNKVLLFLYEKFKNHIYVYVYIYLYIHIYVLYCVLSNQIGDMSIFYLEIGGF